MEFVFLIFEAVVRLFTETIDPKWTLTGIFVIFTAVVLWLWLA